MTKAPVENTQFLEIMIPATPPAPPPFEPVEKKLIVGFHDSVCLRKLDPTFWDEVCHAAKCEIVAKCCNSEVDSYVLSESSLFVADSVFMLKTCGTTEPLCALPLILKKAAEVASCDAASLVTFCWFNRMSYLGPAKDQPECHQTFGAEVDYLKQFFPEGQSRSIPVHVCPSQRTEPLVLKTTFFHAFFYGQGESLPSLAFDEWIFYRIGSQAQDDFVREVVTPLKTSSLVSDKFFEPCGFSCNAIMTSQTLNVHISPEDEVAYASVELTGLQGLPQSPDSWAVRLFAAVKPVVGVHVKVELQKLSELLLSGLSVTCYWTPELPVPSLIHESESELALRTTLSAGAIT